MNRPARDPVNPTSSPRTPKPKGARPGSDSTTNAQASIDETRWVSLGPLERFGGEPPHAVTVGEADLVVVRSRGKLRVFEGRCPHQGALLGEGEVEGEALICRNHRWRFDVETGARIGGRQCLRAHATRETERAPKELMVALAATDHAPPALTATRTLSDLPGPRGLPLVGNLLSMTGDQLHLKFEAWSRTYGPLCTVPVGVRTLLLVCDPVLAESMLRARPDTYRRISNVETVFAEMSAAGVFSAEGDAWRPQRRLAMEALSARHLRGFFPSLKDVSDRLLRRWRFAAESGRVLDVADELKRFTVDVTTLLVFGHDLGTLERDDDDVIQRHLELVFPAFDRRLNSVIPLWRYVKLPEDRRLDRALAAIHDWLRTLIEETRSRLDREPSRRESPSNFMEAMIAMRDDDGHPFSDEVIFGNALTMLLAGEDTTAYTLAWAVHHLCDEAAATEALREEVVTVLGDARMPTSLEQAGLLAFAGAVANETMRLRPVAPLLFLEPVRDVVVEDVAVPKGTRIIIAMRPPTQEPAHFAEPLAFRPTRWMPGAPRDGAHDGSTHMPFGSGPRICPGRTLALLEMRMVLATLYRNFDVSRVGRSRDVGERLSFTMMPTNLRVRLRRRA